jgi:hypothetical protein
LAIRPIRIADRRATFGRAIPTTGKKVLGFSKLRPKVPRPRIASRAGISEGHMTDDGVSEKSKTALRLMALARIELDAGRIASAARLLREAAEIASDLEEMTGSA